MCVGDFIEIIEDSENWGGLPHSNGLIADFRNFIFDAELHEMIYVGPCFTWINKRIGEDLILEKLDRVFCSES